MFSCVWRALLAHIVLPLGDYILLVVWGGFDCVFLYLDGLLRWASYIYFIYY